MNFFWKTCHFDTIIFVKLYMYTWNMGCKRLQTGANGCARVWAGALGHRGHRGHNNKPSRGRLWTWRPVFGRHGRGNFPGHDVFWRLPKMLKYGCRWATMDADGCNRVCEYGDAQKQGKKIPKWASRAHIWTHGQVQKMQHVGMDGHGDQGGARGAKEGEQRAWSPSQIGLESKKARK